MLLRYQKIFMYYFINIKDVLFTNSFTVLSFCDNNFLRRVCSDVVNGIVAKCLNASKQKTKEKGIEIIMLFIEAEKPDVVQVARI